MVRTWILQDVLTTQRVRYSARWVPLVFSVAMTMGLAVAADKPVAHSIAKPVAHATRVSVANLAAFKLPSHVSAAQRSTSVPDIDSAVVRDLLAGKDSRAAVADALAHPETLKAKAAVIPGSHSSAFNTYADGARHLQQALGVGRNAWSTSERKAARSQLADALTSLRARKLLVDARIEQIDRLVAAPTMPVVARQRWTAHRAALVASVSRLDEAVQRGADTLAFAPVDTLPALDELELLVAAETRVSAPPTYAAATLPVFRPRLGARDPAMSPVITPTYADASNDNAPVAADYGATEDAPLSPAILSQAQSLSHDYTRIFDFVRSQVRTQSYAGAQKGAEASRPLPVRI